MSETNRIPGDLKTPFHPVSHHDSPGDVLGDAKLSAAEKRTILSSWASDMYAVESNPALRDVPGLPHRLRLNDILAALRVLDRENDPPPRGGAAMRIWRPVSVHAVASDSAAGRHRPVAPILGCGLKLAAISAIVRGDFSAASGRRNDAHHL